MYGISNMVTMFSHHFHKAPSPYENLCPQGEGGGISALRALAVRTFVPYSVVRVLL